MTRTIDSLSPRDEELRSKPASQARADGLVSKPISATAPNPSPAGKSGSPFVGSGKTNPSRADKTDSKSKSTHKRHLFYKLGALVLLISLAIIGWQYWGRDFMATRSNDPNKKPVARLYDAYITEQQFQDNIRDRKLISKKLHDGTQDQYSEEQAYDDLLLERALEAEAKKRNILVTELDIDTQIINAKISVDKLNKDADSAGISRSAIRRGWKIEAYKAKLATHLINSRDVRQYFVRWDFAPEPYGTDVVSNASAFADFQVKAREKLDQLIEAPLKAGKTQDELLKIVDIDIDKYDAQVKPLDLVARSITGMNRQADAQFQDGKYDWQAIEGLNKDGQYSDIIRSDGGYFAVYYLKHKNNGNYISWNEFLNSVKKNTKKFTKSIYVNKYLAVQTDSAQCRQEQANTFGKILAWIGLNQQAEACGSGHLNRFVGVIRDSGGNTLSGLTVKVIPRDLNAVQYCAGGSTGGTYTTNSSGYWETGNASTKNYSCFMQWAMIVSNSCGASQWYPLLNPGTNNGTVTNNVIFNGGSCATLDSIVAIEKIDCAADTITGWAVSPSNPGGPLLLGNKYDSYVSFFFRDPNNPSFYIPPEANWNTFGNPTGYTSFRGEFHTPNWLMLGNWGTFGTADTNPSFYAGGAGANPVENLAPPDKYGTGHRYTVSGLFTNHEANVPGRSIRDGRVWSIIPGGLDPSTSRLSNAFGTTAEVNFQCGSKYNVNGRKDTNGAPLIPAIAPNHSSSTVSTSSPSQSTNNNPFTLFNLNRDVTNTITASNAGNWEKWAWSVCLDGNINCHATAVKSTESDLVIDKNAVPFGSNPDVQFYYRPLPANLTAKAVLEDGTNPCTKPASDYSRQLCNQIGTVRLVATSGTGSVASLQANLNRTYAIDTGDVSMNNANSEASLPNLYPWYYNIYPSGTPPAGFTISKYELCDASNNCTALAANFVVYPNDNRVIKITYTLAKPTILSSKIAPGNFTYWQQGSPLSTNIGSVAISNIANIWPCNTSLSDHWTGPADFCSQVDYGGQKTIDLTAPEGWEVRGYSFCDHTWWWNCGTSTDDAVAASAADITNGTSDHKIILNNNADKSTMQIIIGVNGSGLFTVAGKTIAGGNNIGFRYYFKPKPVSVKGRVLIDMQGGNAQANSDLNPCTSALKASSNYKTQLCNVKVRAIRMNSAGTTDNFAGSDIDPVAGNIISCSSSLLYQDFVPQRPGYNYSFVKNYYCAGSDASPSANLDGATPYIQVGKTWDAAGGVSDNTDPNESNLAIFRNLYPGKYRLQYIDTPTYNGEQAYDDQVSVCQPNSDNCSNAVAPSEPLGICPGTNWRQTYPEWNGVFHNEACTNSSGSSDNIPRTQFQCSPVPNVWPTNGTPPGCIALKSPRVGFDVPGAVGNFMVNPLNQTNPANMYREANILFTPKFKIINSTNTTVLCNKVTGKAIYMPNPTSSVWVYLRFDNFDLRDLSFAVKRQPTDPSNNFSIDVPTYNHNYAGYNESPILKDGQTRGLRIYAEFPDDDLKAGYPDTPPLSPKSMNTPGWKYSPQQIDDGTLRHKCVNSADCSAFSGYNLTYLDQDDTSYKITMRMTNTGQSLWMWRFNDSGFDRTTGHNLSVTAATTSAGWGINYPTLPDGTHVISSSPDGVQTVAGDNYIDYTVTVVPPPDGGSNAVLEFVMNATYSGNPTDSGPFPNPLPPAWQCKTKVEIRQSYKPWLRAQNGNVSALSTLMNQPKAGRGTYKAQTPTRTGDVYPKKGTIDWQTNIGYPNNPTAQGKADVNLHAQYSVLAAVNNVTTNRFCSSNAYDFGRDALPPSAYNPVTTSCNLLGYNLNLSDTLRADLSDVPQGTYNTIYDNAANLANPAGGKCDDSDMSSTTKNGPHELSPPNEYYRFDSRNPGPTLNAPTLDKFGIYPSLVRIKDTQPTPANVTRPCPTIFNFGNTLGSATLPTFVFAGRSTLVIDGDLNIVGDVKYDNSALGASIYQYSGLLEDDQAALNFLPNLGVIVKGDIIISDNVKEISGDYFATGKIRTCESYNNPGNGVNQPGNTVGQTLKNANSEEVDTVTKKRAPYRDDPDSARCKQKLVVHGTLAATRFNLGRNYLDFGGIATRMNLNPVPGIIPGQLLSPVWGKFCVDNPGILHCNIDFDNPGTINTVTITQSEGYPQSYYYGGPAEDIVGNGLSLIYPPPGFIDTASGNLNKPQYLDATSAPRF